MIRENVADTLDVSIAHKSVGTRIDITIRLKNYGKTPARILHGEIEFYPVSRVLHSGPPEWPIKSKHVLGEAEEGDNLTFTTKPDLTHAEVQSIHDGSNKLILAGWFTYLDPWDKIQTGWVGWTYNPTMRRMTPDEHNEALENYKGGYPNTLTGYIAQMSEFLRKLEGRG